MNATIKKLGRRFVLLASVCVATAVCSSGYSDQLAASSAGGEATLTGKPSKNWADSDLSGDDRPFAAARRFIDRQFQSANNGSQVVDAYKNAATKNPANALDQFRWAYAAEKLTDIPHPVMGKDAQKIADALANAVQPNTFNYLRARLLCAVWDPKYRKLAERLLAYDPNDVKVKSTLAFLLSLSKIKADQDKAVELQSEVVASGKDTPTCYFTFDYIYANIGFTRSDPSYYVKALAAEKEFLALTPSYDWRRKAALWSISVLEKRIAAAGGAT